MPKKLMSDIYGSYREMEDMISEPMETPQAGDQQQPADALAGAGGAPAAPVPPPPGGEAPTPEGGAV